MPRVPKSVISQVGVAGAVSRMTAGPQQPQEIKQVEINTIIDTPLTGNWHYLNATSALLSQVRVGAAANQRVGKKIRVVGIMLRGTANTADPSVGGSGIGNEPFCIDMIWDTQCNGAQANLAAVYSTVAFESLPNVLYQDRFRWIKRYNHAGGNGATTAVNMTAKCNKLIEYIQDTGAVVDLMKTNLLVTFATSDTNPTFIGTLRILYVDA